ncbi:MAG TPA: nuclear transport factor 2 family protein [Rubricoccaceae bacterium]
MRLAALACLVAAAPAAAQPDPGSQDPEAAVRATIMRLFDGMRARDTSAVRAALHPDARLHTVVRDGEGHRLEEGSMAEFIAALGASPVGWDERIGDIEVRFDDGLATAWTAYRLFVGERFIHCGVDAFTLVQDAAGWRILQIADTRRTGCE